MVTRQEIQDSARKLINAPWHHQGRSLQQGIDCIGGLIFVGLDTGYFSAEQIKEVDVVDYSRTPKGYELLVQYLRQFWEEIPITEAKEGDILSFRMAGERLTSHVGIIVRGEREYLLVHSLETRHCTIEDTLRRWSKFATYAFRFRGVID